MAKNLKLHVVGASAPGVDPPRPLRKAGRALWNAVQREYDIADIGGVTLLQEACAAIDRAEELAAEIAADGAVIRTRGGVKEHPALKAELACRAFAVRTIQKLGLNFGVTIA
jgi:hypothetical protein